MMGQNSGWSEAFAYFQNLVVAPARLDNPAINAVAAALRASHVNGGAAFGRWRLPDHQAIADQGARRALDVGGFFGGLLLSEGVRSELPELQIPARFETPPSFRHMGSLSLECDLANALHQGGAYHEHAVEGAARDAKRLAKHFCEVLIGDRFEEITVYVSSDAWSPWFRGVAWDTSWFGLDQSDRTCWLLCKTDTD